ncbi:beta-Ig-H3 fasciclin [Micractinium conductrix]|uniref:Beta-Ig-H3 fasciclin n=1 Tax=Micractinium conductrix TaxID=554055 RepID=A0A2P6V103_9CHLO|nr:beta-Ig-H3 fasciclin [Micractinium conductrix]|eukprot:PSC67768.1 beta-Ig-H3 fasciclin [Micractinium conductrix]
MPSRSLLALACAALVLATGARAATAGAAHNVPVNGTFAPTFWDALCKEQHRFSILKDIIRCAGMVKLLQSTNLCGTFFPPDNKAWDEVLVDDLGISVKELLLPVNQRLLTEFVQSLVVPGTQLYKEDWPVWPKKVWYKTLHPKNKIGIEMDDGGPRTSDSYDVDGNDDDAELIPKPYLVDLKVGTCGVMQSLDDVVTWKGWKNAIGRNVHAWRRRHHHGKGK